MSLGNQVNPALAARMSGVRQAEEARPAAGQPQKVIDVLEAKVQFVRFYDERGIERTAMYFVVGGQYYATKDTIEWCARQLFPMTDWLRKGVDAKLAAKDASASTADLPKEDSVNVLGEL